MENTNEDKAALITGLDALGYEVISLNDQTNQYPMPATATVNVLTLNLTIRKKQV